MSRVSFLLSLFILCCSDAFAQNKGLDPTFGNGGIAKTAPYTNTRFKSPAGLIIQPDGKILIAGNFIAQYKSNGTPDSSFATNGFFSPPYSGFSNAIALLPDGKIFSLGQPDTGCSYIVRLSSNGTIDSTFGVYGISKNSRLSAWNIFVQPDGKIIIIGHGCGIIGSSADSVTVGRFLPDGSLDTLFGKRGFAQAYLGNYGGSITNLALLSDGRIAMGGISKDSGIIMLRFLPNGQLDSSLGGRGRIFPFYAWYCHALSVLPDGRVLFTLGDLNYEDITRLNIDGSSDTTFGDKGFISIDGQNTLFILPLPDGRILCGGIRDGDYAVACLRANGKGLDTTFGQNGSIVTDITGQSKDRLTHLAIQPDNKILGFGTGAYATSPSGTMLVRYNANATTGIQASNSSSRVMLAVYPNPVKSYISISGVFPNQLATVRIIAADGRLIENMEAPHGLTFNVNGQTPGIYLLSVVLKSGEVASSRFTITE